MIEALSRLGAVRLFAFALSLGIQLPERDLPFAPVYSCQAPCQGEHIKGDALSSRLTHAMLVTTLGGKSADLFTVLRCADLS